MKRILSFVLCVTLMCSVLVFGAQAASTEPVLSPYLKHTYVDDPLFALSKNTNKVGQQFVPDGTSLVGVRMYLESYVSSNDFTVSVYAGAGEDGTLLGSETFTLSRFSAKWCDFNFTTPITVTPYKKHTFVVSCAKTGGTYGKAGYTSANCSALNYDANAYGGWKQEPHCLAFEVLTTNVNTCFVFESQTQVGTALYNIFGNYTASQAFTPSFSALESIQVYLDNTEANNTLEIEVYKGNVPDGILIATGKTTMTNTGAAWQTVTFDKPLCVEKGGLYSIKLYTFKKAVWYGQTNAATDLHKAFDYVSNAWQQQNNATGFKVIGATEIGPFNNAVEYLVYAINQISETVTLQDAESIYFARNAYDTLSRSLQGSVTNYEKLEKAEADLAVVIKADEEAAANAVMDAISSLNPMSLKKGQDIVAANELLNETLEQRGMLFKENITNTADLTKAYADYNALVDTYEPYSVGDVNEDGAIDAKDALMVLKYAVSKATFTDVQVSCGDTNADDGVDAKDALDILKYSVGKVTKFSAPDAPTYEHLQEEVLKYTSAGQELYDATYQTMIERTQANGYAATSLTGAYRGMFGRDSSIQIMSHVAQGDYDYAQRIMQYILDYHKTYGYNYVLHVMENDAAPYSTMIQVDTTYFFIHAWYLYATQAPDSPEKQAFLQNSEAQIKTFANYFLNSNYIHENGLVWNVCFEHVRDGVYWQCYDMLTNTYMSQALHELSLYFAQKDPAQAASWDAQANSIVAAVEKNLVTEIDGLKCYAELNGRHTNEPESANRFIQGFSFVNMAPMSCDWFGANPEILENTYQLYMKYNSVMYYDNYHMLDICYTYDGNPVPKGNHVVGKHLAWEILYCKKMGYTDRLYELESFLEDNCPRGIYQETWLWTGGGADSGNQEQAAWLLYANAIAYPEMTK